jgi:carbon-monoxide dehydrogenase medium subunit
MITTDFDYAAPTSIEDAVRELGADGAVLAGGQALLTDLKLGRARPARVVDIGKVAGLDAIDAAAGGLRVGATVTLDALSRSDLLASGPAALADAVAVIGDPQVRNRATVGGGIANSTPGADLPAVALACDATLELATASGSQSRSADEAFASSPAGAGEIIVAVTFPSEAGASAYVKLADPGSGYALCGVAAVVALGADGTVASCRVAVTGATDAVVRLAGVESALAGTAAGADDIAGAAAAVGAAGLSFRSDVAATAAYRAHLTEVLAARALTRAVERARSTTA